MGLDVRVFVFGPCISLSMSIVTNPKIQFTWLREMLSMCPYELLESFSRALFLCVLVSRDCMALCPSYTVRLKANSPRFEEKIPPSTNAGLYD